MQGVAKIGTSWLLLAASLAWGQDLIGPKGPSVTMLPAPIISIPGGKPGEVQLRFRVVRGYHVNSNRPKAEFLIPTALKLDAPTDIVVGKISYPPGQDMSFPFSPDEKLSVYSGDFLVAVVVRPLHTVIPGKYMLHGKLRYQACDKAACYPPKELPVEFEVKVAKAAAPHKGNPAQSPHVHRLR
ncbi:MAG: disulfide bond formation protein DsbC [Acidobacteria bacterium]|nr:MAG: disulfide bond formation protein DsbC [Acidobacteriota bacterium]PYY04455.1 MAG: disulfide bond formation protein DsbC [Acidobacteriota bacterium]